ncbi:hypothetical protein ACF0H5_001716 [Mactra antiquata]
MDAGSIEEKLQQMHIEYIRVRRKLKKSRRSLDARLHVQQKLREVGINGSGDAPEKNVKENLSKNVKTMPGNAGKGDNEINVKGNNVESQDERIAKFESFENYDRLKNSDLKDDNTNDVVIDDDVVIMPSKDGEVSKQREKSLKLAKTKTKNCVNPSTCSKIDAEPVLPVRKIQDSVSGGENCSTNTYINKSVPTDCTVDNTLKYVDDIINESHVLSEDVFESSLKKEIHFYGDLDFNSGTSLTSLSNKEDEQLDEADTKKTNVRRRSSSRKRRLSGFEVQRRSSRIANSSSQSSTSSSQTSTSPPLFPGNQQCTRMRTHIILSSVFQCLVDEGKRQPEKEFYLDFNHSAVRKSNSTSTGTKVHDNDSEDLFESEDLPEQKELDDGGKDIDDDSKTSLGVSKVDDNSGNAVKESKRSQKMDKGDGLDGLMNEVDNNESEEIKSPILFESQPFTDIFENPDLCKKLLTSETDVSEPPIDSKISIDSHLSQLSNSNIPVVGNADSDSTESSCKSLKPLSNFQVLDNEHIHSICCDEKIIGDSKQLYIICLCSTCLKLYTYNNNIWECLISIKIPFTIRKKSGNVLYRLNNTETVSVILLEPKTNCTIIHCYSYIDNIWQQAQIDKIFCKSLNICPLPDMNMVISYIAGKKTYIDKYSIHDSSKEWSHDQIGSTDCHVLQLLLVKGIQSALVVLTESLQVQIWNHEHSLLLTTIDISDVSPIKPHCTQVYSEQGYLFLPMLSEKKGIQAGSVIVINPYLGTPETLVPIDCHNTWTGTNKVSMLSEDLIVCQQNNGCIRIWNVYSGCLVTTINDVTSSTFYSNNKFLVLAHKQCVHPFYLNIPCEK